VIGVPDISGPDVRMAERVSEPDPDAGTVRWRLQVSYRGRNYSGWARQPGRRTVQGVLETWIARVLRLDRPPDLTCAGRTDAGVHARGQVCHFDLAPAELTDPGNLVRRLARVLPDDLVVSSVEPAPAGFDARFSAVWRRYVYRLCDRQIPPDPLQSAHVVWHRKSLDIDAMNDAAGDLIGYRDFAAFCRARPNATTIRHLLALSASRIDDGPLAGVLEFEVLSDAFCHSMVRSLVGALARVGDRSRDAGWPGRVAEAGIRDPSVPVMPANGLTLEEVGYPADDQLGARAVEARQLRSIHG
jgi:tRNA pseudouridine38-40 synthase